MESPKTMAAMTRLTPDQVEWLREQAFERRCTKSAIVRELIDLARFKKAS